MFSKALSAAALAAAAQAATVSVTVANGGGNATSPYQYGLMFEVRTSQCEKRSDFPDNEQDINNSGDGGVYAELIQNRAFQGNSVSRSIISSGDFAN